MLLSRLYRTDKAPLSFVLDTLSCLPTVLPKACPSHPGPVLR
jgi:hypothetical protein